MSRVESRSNTDLLNVRAILENTSLSASDRMLLISRIADLWFGATCYGSGAHPSDRNVARLNYIGEVRKSG